MEKNTTLNIEDTLNLTCSAAASNLAALSLEVEWLVASDASAGPQLIVRMDRDGTVTGGSAQLAMSRVAPGDFRLIVQKVEQSNSGWYSCRVRVWLPQSSSTWYQAAEMTSHPVQVVVSQLSKFLTQTRQLHINIVCVWIMSTLTSFHLFLSEFFHVSIEFFIILFLQMHLFAFPILIFCPVSRTCVCLNHCSRLQSKVWGWLFAVLSVKRL